MCRKVACPFLLIPTLLILIATGCKSPPPGGEGSIAWVEIIGHSRFEVAQAAKSLLVDKGFHQTQGAEDNMTFERPGSNLDSIAYGGWGERTTLRLRLFLNAPDNGKCLIHSRAFSVRNAGDRIFEDQTELSRLRRKHIQELLDQIKVTLDSQPQLKGS